MPVIKGRSLHYVFKVADRKETARFYRDVLGMKVLRHEEFLEGCDAQCNGDYDSRWSKTMMGYGPEDTHFVVELTYNYGVKHYEKGNDFMGITIRSSDVLKRAKEHNWPIEKNNTLMAPGGYPFHIIDEPQKTDRDPLEKVTLSSSNLLKSLNYWNSLLGLTIFNRSDNKAELGFNENEAKLELQQINEPVNRAGAYGRIAFSCPHDEQPAISKIMEEHKHPIPTPLITLDTPGKASVRVIILADPDGHEICFVDDEGFRQLSQVDPNGDKELNKFIRLDKS